jgi:hypothetical protein
MAKKFKMKAPINEILGVVGGAVAAGYVAKLVNDKLPNLNSTVKSLIPIGLGVVLAGNKNTIVRGIGFGMVGKGGADLASAFLPGVGNVDDNVGISVSRTGIISGIVSRVCLIVFNDVRIGVIIGVSRDCSIIVCILSFKHLGDGKGVIIVSGIGVVSISGIVFNSESIYKYK